MTSRMSRRKCLVASLALSMQAVAAMPVPVPAHVVARPSVRSPLLLGRAPPWQGMSFPQSRAAPAALVALRGGGGDVITEDVRAITVRGVLMIVLAILAEVEVFGKLAKHKILPSVVTRKLTQ